MCGPIGNKLEMCKEIHLFALKLGGEMLFSKCVSRQL